ncbi:MAG: PUA domain-containing protein [Halobacteriaceae archaeon]
MDDLDVSDLRDVASYQFGAGVGAVLFPPGADRSVARSRSGRPRQVYDAAGDRLVSVGTDGRLTLGLAGGRRVVEALDAPGGRVVVGDDSEPYVREGRNVFARFVRDVDPAVRARDEVAVVHHGGALLGVGRAELDAGAMLDFETGMAVKVRHGNVRDED